MACSAKVGIDQFNVELEDESDADLNRQICAETFAGHIATAEKTILTLAA